MPSELVASVETKVIGMDGRSYKRGDVTLSVCYSTKPGAPRLVIRTNCGTLTSSSRLEAISILYIVRTRLTLDQRLLTGTVVRYSHIVVRHNLRRALYRPHVRCALVELPSVYGE